VCNGDEIIRADEMAFMMPVVKNEWDIYKTNRSRRSSECSNPQACRSRKVSEDDIYFTRYGVFFPLFPNWRPFSPN